MSWLAPQWVGFTLLIMQKGYQNVFVRDSYKLPNKDLQSQQNITFPKSHGHCNFFEKWDSFQF